MRTRMIWKRSVGLFIVLFILSTVNLSAQDQCIPVDAEWVKNSEGGFSFSVPSNLKKKPKRGIDLSWDEFGEGDLYLAVYQGDRSPSLSVEKKYSDFKTRGYWNSNTYVEISSFRYRTEPFYFMAVGNLTAFIGENPFILRMFLHSKKECLGLAERIFSSVTFAEKTDKSPLKDNKRPTQRSKPKPTN